MSYDLYDKIKELYNLEKREGKRKASRMTDPKKAALEDLLESVKKHDEIARERGY